MGDTGTISAGATALLTPRVDLWRGLTSSSMDGSMLTIDLDARKASVRCVSLRMQRQYSATAHVSTR